MKKILIMLLLCTACNEQALIIYKNSAVGITHPECAENEIAMSTGECVTDKISFNDNLLCDASEIRSMALLKLEKFVAPEDCKLSFSFTSAGHEAVAPTEAVSFKDNCTLNGNNYSCSLNLTIGAWVDLTDLEGSMTVTCKHHSPSTFQVTGSSQSAVWHEIPGCLPPGGGGGPILGM